MLGRGGGRGRGGGGGRTHVSFPALFSPLLQLVEGQCHISLPEAKVQGALQKLNITINDLPGKRLYVVAAVIESPGEWLPLTVTQDPHL